MGSQGNPGNPPPRGTPIPSRMTDYFRCKVPGLGCPGQEVLGSMVIGSVGYNPNVYPIYKEVISRLLTIDPNFLGHPSGVIQTRD